MGRKIPGRKHRGIRDPEKQAAIRLETIKNKINAPPSNPDHQEISKRLQKVIDLKNKVKSGDFLQRKKVFKDKIQEPNNSTLYRKPEKHIPVFNQFVGESDRQFVHRMNKICTDVVKEAKFEEKYDVEIVRNEQGEVERVVKREKDELELLLKKAKKDAKNDAKRKGKKKKKNKEKQDLPHLSKWQKRKEKLNEKKSRKELNNLDEFQQFRDKVKFGDIVHAPPTIIVSKKVEDKQNASGPGYKNLLLKSFFENRTEKTDSPAKSNTKNNLNKTGNKVIDKKGKRKELPNALRRQLEQQQREIIHAYKELKAKKYK